MRIISQWSKPSLLAPVGRSDGTTNRASVWLNALFAVAMYRSNYFANRVLMSLSASTDVWHIAKYAGRAYPATILAKYGYLSALNSFAIDANHARTTVRSKRI